MRQHGWHPSYTSQCPFFAGMEYYFRVNLVQEIQLAIAVRDGWHPSYILWYLFYAAIAYFSLGWNIYTAFANTLEMVIIWWMLLHGWHPSYTAWHINTAGYLDTVYCLITL